MNETKYTNTKVNILTTPYTEIIETINHYLLENIDTKSLSQISIIITRDQSEEKSFNLNMSISERERT